MTGVVTIICAVGSRAQADAIATPLVEQRLAACEQVMPVGSIYRWDGAVRRDDEWLLLVKTLASAFDAVATCIRERHDYDVPEVIALPVIDGTTDYLAWVASEIVAS